MMYQPFNQNGYINEVVQETGLTQSEIQAIHEKYRTYGNEVYMLPITIWAEPTPYSPIRIDPRHMRIYVPNKAKLVSTIRNLILKELGTRYFMNEFLPLFGEVILKSHLYLPTPKAYKKEERYLAECKILRPIVTPDVDNVEKIVNDAIKSFVIYDDAQIVSNITEKYYSNRPRMEACVYYNNEHIHRVHEKIQEQRKATWKRKLNSGDLDQYTSLLRKYYNS